MRGTPKLLEYFRLREFAMSGPDNAQNGFHTASVIRVDFVMPAVCPLYPQHRTFPDSVGTSR
jgi:hypothetical protein